MFTVADFELFAERFQADTEWNSRRLEIRRRLQALGTAIQEALGAEGLALDRRESLHHPHASNRKRVRRQRTMLFRDRKARRALQAFLGRDLGKDLDSAHNNVHLQAGLDAREVFWGLRLERGAWYDLNALLRRAETGEGRRALAAACQRAPGFVLLVDGGGARPLEGVGEKDWRDLAGLLRPGESALEVRQSLPAGAAEAAGMDLREGIVADMVRLAELFRLAHWSLEGGGASF